MEAGDRVASLKNRSLLMTPPRVRHCCRSSAASVDRNPHLLEDLVCLLVGLSDGAIVYRAIRDVALDLRLKHLDGLHLRAQWRV